MFVDFRDPNFSMIYLIVGIVLVIFLIGKIVFRVLWFSENVVMAAQTGLVLLEAYRRHKVWADAMKNNVVRGIRNMEGFGFNCNATTDTTARISLVKASWCQACRRYSESGMWQSLKAQIAEVLPSFSFSFDVYDIDNDSEFIRQNLGVDRKMIKYVPAMFVSTSSRNAAYTGDVYDNDNIVRTIHEILSIS